MPYALHGGAPPVRTPGGAPSAAGSVCSGPLYHALQGAETAQHYIQDATQAGDEELVQFFREAQDWQRHLATQAKAVLKQRLSAGDGHHWNQEAKIWNLTLMA